MINSDYNYFELVKSLRDKLIVSREELIEILGVSFATVNIREKGYFESIIKAKRKNIELCLEQNIIGE